MTFTAPSAGLYDIIAFGAQGGSEGGGGGAGGLGAEGGGSFVVAQGTATPLVIAGRPDRNNGRQRRR